MLAFSAAVAFFFLGEGASVSAFFLLVRLATVLPFFVAVKANVPCSAAVPDGSSVSDTGDESVASFFFLFGDAFAVSLVSPSSRGTFLGLPRGFFTFPSLDEGDSGSTCSILTACVVDELANVRMLIYEGEPEVLASACTGNAITDGSSCTEFIKATDGDAARAAAAATADAALRAIIGFVEEDDVVVIFDALRR